jgi:predicted MFS family arabinose efflux permease
MNRTITEAVEPSGATGLHSSSARVYFGWRVVLALMLCSFVLMGVCIYSFIVLLDALSKDFGWSALQTGSLVSAMWLVAPLALLSAPVIQRLGPWRVLMIGLCIQAAAFLLLGYVGYFWQIYVLRIVMGVGKVMLMTSSPVIVARWFLRRFPMAMGIVWAAVTGSGLFLAPLTERLTSALGWRAASWVCAGALAAVVPIAVWLERGPASPEQLGLSRDGHKGQVHGSTETAYGGTTDAHNLPRWRQLLASLRWSTATPIFIAVLGIGMVSIAFQGHLPGVLEHAGLTPSAAAGELGVTSAGAMVGSATAGWLLGRYPAVWSSLAVSLTLFGGLALFLLVVLHQPTVLMAGLSCFSAGLGFGGGEILWIELVKRQFGEAAFAMTYGGYYFALQAGYAAGGSVGGLALDHILAPGFIVVLALLYLPAAVFSLWRPGARSRVATV